MFNETGTYRTVSGHRAVVVQLRTIGGEWRLRGFIEDDATAVLHPYMWDMSGRSINGKKEFDLEARVDSNATAKAPEPRVCPHCGGALQ